MKLAVLSDIHGNLPALMAVLAAIERDAPDRIAVLGDLVGYYYDAGKVIDAVLARSPIVVRGNHERALLEQLSGRDDGLAYRTKYGRSLGIAATTLRDDQVEWLSGLDDAVRITINGRAIHAMHEANGVPGGYLYPDATPKTLAAVAMPGADLTLVGHTHYPFVAPVCDSLVMNPGSVGQARDVGGHAQWALVHLDSMSVELRSTPYDTSQVEADVWRHDPDLPYLSEVLRRGRCRA